MSQNASFYIEHLGLKPHPEGGYFKETYRSEETISASALPLGFGGDRSFSTAIYYLLEQGDYSAFHRIKSDECWHFYAGGTLHIHIIYNNNYSCIQLGSETDKGDLFQYVVPANAWFASEPAAGTYYSLVGCTVAPGFDFADFEMGKKQELTTDYPNYQTIIERLCR